jgi:hypothetical protein
MATSQFTTPIDSDTDANFRAWGGQISAQLAAIGLTQAADTGQIDWTTVNVNYTYPFKIGYEIWSFNDAAQSTAPIFIRLDYGASSAEAPVMFITVGNATDGAGTITGAFKSTPYQFMGLSTTFGSAWPSFLCYKAASGFLGVALKIGSQVPYGTGFYITRTNDTAGNVTADGWNMYCSGTPGQSLQLYHQNLVAGEQLPASGTVQNANVATWPLSLTSSAAGGSIQAIPLFALQPAIQVNAQLCVIINAEVPYGNQFTLNIVGSTPRNFIAVSSTGFPTPAGSGTYGLAMIWE